MLFFSNYVPFYKIMLFEKNANKSKNTFSIQKRLVFKKETQQVHNEIQINMWFMLTCTLVLQTILSCSLFSIAALHLIVSSQKVHSLAAHGKTPKAGYELFLRQQKKFEQGRLPLPKITKRCWDQHALQCVFRFQCTLDPGSDRFRRRSVIHSELQILLFEQKQLKTSNKRHQVLGSRDELCSNCSIKSDPIIIKICELCQHCYLAEIVPVCSNHAKNYASIIYKGLIPGQIVIWKCWFW